MDLVVCLALLAAQAATPADSLEQEHVTGTLGVALDAQLSRYAEYGFWGTVLVVRQGEIVLLKGYGLANAERGTPNTPATRFEMNSMTKMFTGVAILQLDAAGRLHVTDPVERYLGAFSPGKQGSTIAQLANHTAGLIVQGTGLDCLYAASSSFKVLASIPFYLEGSTSYIGFDPSTGTQTRLHFDQGGALSVQMADGRIFSLTR